MFSIILGSIGFLCYFVYDINSVTKKNQILQRGFTVGSSLVFLGTIRMLIDGWANRNQNVLICLLWSVFGIVMFILLIYTLFFALPFNTTYVEKSNEREAYTEGVYALCRHPGVLWYAGMYISFLLIVYSLEMLWCVMIYIGWNLAYIIFQDMIIFPKTFTNYEEYKKMTPFLIPNRQSLRRCIRTLKKGGQA